MYISFKLKEYLIHATKMSDPPRGSYRDSIYEDYALVFPDIDSKLASFEIRITKAPVRRKMLKDFDPDMYIPGYQRFCTKAFAPTLLETQEKQDEAEQAGQDVMIFPLYGEGVRRAYVCNHKVNKFVGLKENTLENRFEYPHLPCCYPTPQKDNIGRPRYQYEHKSDEDVAESVKRIHRPKIFISNKAMQRNNYGQLPSLVDKFLKTIDLRVFTISNDDQMSYVRQGTLRNINSVLDAIIKAIIDYYNDIDEEVDKIEYIKFITEKFPILKKIFNADKSYESFDDIEKSNYLAQIRKNFVSLLSANIVAQSSFNMELKTLQDQLVNNTSYLDVKLLWRILEEIFHINIVLFQRNQDHPHGVLSSPLFLQEYLQYQRRKETSKWRFTVFLFETMGGEADRLEYPQVELIKYFDFFPPPLTVFSWFNGKKDRQLLLRLQTCFNEIYSYNGHANLPIINIFSSKPVSQCADFYGKIRLIQFANGLCIMTEPLPSMDRAELSSIIEKKCTLIPVQLERAKTFLSFENITDIRKVLIGEYIVGLQCRKNTDTSIQHIQRFVSFYIPIVPIKDNNDFVNLIQAPVSAPSFLSEESLLDSFNRMARLARYLIEYVLWIFSKWHKNSQGDVSDKNYIAKFTAEKFQINNNHNYPLHIPRQLNGNLSGVLNGGKILVSSADVRNRLIFALQIRLSQNSKKVLNYHSRTYIQQYYQDVTDFDLQGSNIILFGQEMVLSWINSKLPHYVLYDRIQTPICTPAEEIGETEDIEEIGGIEEKKENDQICDLIAKNNLIIDPYFIKLENLDDNIYIVQQASSLSNALYICDMWYNMGYNIGPNDTGKTSTEVPFQFIAYNDAYDYTIKLVNKKKKTKDEIVYRTVLQYKVEGQVFTMALLNYST